ncbi:MAG: hypothetical protein WCO98_08925 [bacterium]
MRTILLTFTLAIGMLLGSTAVMAHPPSDIQVTLDTKTHVLNVTALHQVKDAKVHYIGEIDVLINDVQVITQKFTSQTDLDKQVASYTLIDAKVGDVIKVTAKCNMFGSKTVSYTVINPEKK